MANCAVSVSCPPNVHMHDTTSVVSLPNCLSSRELGDRENENACRVYVSQGSTEHQFCLHSVWYDLSWGTLSGTYARLLIQRAALMLSVHHYFWHALSKLMCQLSDSPSGSAGEKIASLELIKWARRHAYLDSSKTHMDCLPLLEMSRKARIIC